MDITNHLELSELTLKTILRNKKAILAGGENAVPLYAFHLNQVWVPIMLALAKLLNNFYWK